MELLAQGEAYEHLPMLMIDEIKANIRDELDDRTVQVSSHGLGGWHGWVALEPVGMGARCPSAPYHP